MVQASDAAASLQQCDTGEEAHVCRRVAYTPSLTGVWHAAGVLADATLPQQKALSLACAYVPKATGAWSLHAMTATSGVSAFALFSSVASIAHPADLHDRRDGVGRGGYEGGVGVRWGGQMGWTHDSWLLANDYLLYHWLLTATSALALATCLLSFLLGEVGLHHCDDAALLARFGVEDPA